MSIIKLFGHVEGQIGENDVFSIKISTVDTIDDLKDAIKERKENLFKDRGVDASAITIWKLGDDTGIEEKDLKVTLLSAHENRSTKVQSFSKTYRNTEKLLQQLDQWMK
jgi:hypothetical protein